MARASTRTSSSADAVGRATVHVEHHSGVTLAPLVGRLLAKEILSGEVDHLVAPFRPDRFVRNTQPLLEDR